MLTITIEGAEFFDPVKEEFIQVPGKTISLEHSLISISKWEAKWKKPFLDKNQKTEEEIVDYIRCMCLTPNVDDLLFFNLSVQNLEAIKNYIDDPMTATWFNNQTRKKANNRVLTSELIYYYMIANNIPFECQKWHINRLLTLITVCGIENAPKKKMSKRDIMSRQAALNAARRNKLHTSG